MGEFVHVYNDGGGIRDVPVADGVGNIQGNRGNVANQGSGTVVAIGIPFVIPPGDNATNGLQFTGTAGSFSLSAPIIAAGWNALKGCYMWMPAYYGGSSYPAGWYWAIFSSDIAGILYMDKYVSGTPQRVTNPTAVPINLSGRINQSISEITGPTGFIIKGGSLGPNGALRTHLRVLGTTSGAKTIKGYLDSTNIFGAIPGTSSNVEYGLSMINQGSEALQVAEPINSPIGIGASLSSFGIPNYAAIDTTVDRTFSISLQIGTNVTSVILLHASVTATYGG